MKSKYTRLKLACYSSNSSMAIVGTLSPILFLSFRSLYGISYSLLGFLVLINFLTQLAVDLIFSFFSHKFDIAKTVKSMPVIAVIGYLIYALWPFVFPQSVYTGLVIGTVIFSAATGLGEVLISPVIAAIPSENPDREMSKVHSVFAWAVVAVVILSTLFLLVFGSEKWQWLALIFTIVPGVSAFLFAGVEIPEMETPQKVSGALKLLKNKTLLLCVAAIFLGGAAECTMSQWCSGYIEKALGISKVWGDIFGVAVFSVMLGMGRTLYAKVGKNIERVLIAGVIGAAICYLTAALTDIPLLGLIACAFTGFCVSMLWPGCLIAAADRITNGGLFLYAMMAAGGDLGASIGPQLIGIITDVTSAATGATAIATTLGITPEQLGMKFGMLAAAVFPIAAIPVYIKLRKTEKE